jgi:hypothetical protein
LDCGLGHRQLFTRAWQALIRPAARNAGFFLADSAARIGQTQQRGRKWWPQGGRRWRS